MIRSVKLTLFEAGAALLLAMSPQDSELVKDLADGAGPAASGHVSSILPFGDDLLLAASLPRGEGLWRTDGTTEGTVLLRSMAITDAGPPEAWGSLGEGRFLFRQTRTGRILITDGSVEGTDLVALDRSVAERPRGEGNFVRIGTSSWLFVATSPAAGRELWITDGTDVGTIGLDFLEPGPASGVSAPSLAPLGQRALFFSSPSPPGTPPQERQQELWRSDGSAARTDFVKSLGPGEPQFFLVPAGEPVPERALLSLDRGDGGPELWTTDGTDQGTVPLELAVEGSTTISLEEVAAFGRDWMLVVRSPAASGPDSCALYRTEGPAAVKVLDFEEIFQAARPTTPTCPLGLVVSGGLGYFHFNDGVHGFEPWVTDGTLAGTQLLADLFPGSPGSVDRSFQTWQDQVVFLARRTFNSESEAFISNGTAAGTRPFTSRRPERFLGTWGVRVLFTLRAGNGDLELWGSDGTPAGERRLSVLARSVRSSSAGPSLRVGERLLIGARTEDRDHALGVTDGTGAGTELFELDLDPKLGRGYGIGPVKSFGGNVFFSDGRRLFRTDGTAEGTEILVQARSFIYDFGKVGGRFVYWDDGGDGFEPWVSDSTPEGTFQLLDIYPGLVPDPRRPGVLIPASSLPAQFTSFGSFLVFTAENEALGREVWITNGTRAGTRPLETIPGPNPSPDGGAVFDLEVVGERLFFAHSDSGVWVKDGAEGSLRPVVDGTGQQFQASRLTAYRGRCLFLEGSEPTGSVSRLVLTDGTPEGTNIITTFTTSRRNLGEPVVAGDRIFFTRRDPATGEELWTSDGTESGTVPLGDARPGPEGLEPREMAAIDGRLVFTGSSSRHGREVWTSDGTTEGTRLLSDVLPGVPGSRPRFYRALGDWILFQAFRDDVGTELFRIDRSALQAACRPEPRTLCLQEGRFSVSVDWRNQRTGTFGTGTALAYSDDTGMFWFFNQENVELLVKLLAGRPRNGHHWAFAGALTDVETWVTVVDHQTGKERTFHTPPRVPQSRQLCGFAETRAFDDEDALPVENPIFGASAVPVAAASPSLLQPAAGEAGECSPGPDALLLQDGRFAVEVTWETARQGGRSGVGTPVPGTDKSGYFWFFNQANLELVVKILDGRPSNGRFWVLYGALSDVGYEIKVTDLDTCASKTYVNTEGNLCGRADVQAF